MTVTLLYLDKLPQILYQRHSESLCAADSFVALMISITLMINVGQRV